MVDEALAGRLIRPGAFDIQGCKRILDAGCGNGRYSRFLLRQADSDALLTAFDYSQGMLQRARERLHSDRFTQVAADLTRLPYARWGWPSNTMPNSSAASRSCQLAPT